MLWLQSMCETIKDLYQITSEWPLILGFYLLVIYDYKMILTHDWFNLNVLPMLVFNTGNILQQIFQYFVPGSPIQFSWKTYTSFKKKLL